MEREVILTQEGYDKLQEEIEYLMARGLSEDEATATIIRGFLDVKISGLPEVLQQQIDAAIDTAEKGF